ncbi:MAG TPA: tRNA (adenosine(37)-N6)-dimethylallyltransferase MiaA [Polyangia bacterium]|jgi:tRNA dimethylallyltransferase|nr:tRNA (adenosine(37)-N6)-dimethylallyltransferase MiaA [Polyangia bacterium]
MTTFVAVLGPTASGKSALAMALAQRANGEIVACDSQQVYIGMDVGTGKPTRADRRLVPHHLLDLVHPDEVFHAVRWAVLARVAIARIAARGHLPIVAGGTGLYYRALTVGLFEAPPPDEAIRERHRAEAERLGITNLHDRLAAVDPIAAAAIGRHDLIRISRGLEVFEQTGTPISTLRRQAAAPAGDLRARAIVLDPPLPELRARIERRVGEMMAGGFLDEVRALRAAGYSPSLRPLQALGYQQLGAHLDGVCSLEQAVNDIVSATAAYARRQRTWFRKEASVARLADAAAPIGIDELLVAVAERPPT